MPSKVKQAKNKLTMCELTCWWSQTYKNDALHYKMKV